MGPIPCVSQGARVMPADDRGVRVARLTSSAAGPRRAWRAEQAIHGGAFVGRGLDLDRSNVHQCMPSCANAGAGARSTLTAHALNSAVPDFGSDASMVSRFVATSSGKCSVMKTMPARSAVSMRAGVSTVPRREVTRTRWPSAMPIRAASSGEMSSVSPKCNGDW